MLDDGGGKRWRMGGVVGGVQKLSWRRDNRVEMKQGGDVCLPVAKLRRWGRSVGSNGTQFRGSFLLSN